MVWTLATTQTTLTVESSTQIAQNITHEPVAQLLLQTYGGMHKNPIKKVKSHCRFQAEVEGQSQFKLKSK